jgi:hypothetical protein
VRFVDTSPFLVFSVGWEGVADIFFHLLQDHELDLMGVIQLFGLLRLPGMSKLKGMLHGDCEDVYVYVSLIPVFSHQKWDNGYSDGSQETKRLQNLENRAKVSGEPEEHGRESREAKRQSCVEKPGTQEGGSRQEEGEEETMGQVSTTSTVVIHLYGPSEEGVGGGR